MQGRQKLLAAAAALAAAASLAPAVASAAPKASGPKCFGKSPTIVSTKSHVTVNGTSKSDVIDAFGTGVTVLGLGGNDLICVGNAKKVDAGDGNDKVQFASGTILGGKGNDALTQKGKPKGKTAVFGGDGNDTIKLIKPGAVVDSGNGLDILTVPPQYLAKTTIVPRDGLIVNGTTQRIDAPKSAPDAAISYDGDPGPVVFARTVTTANVLDANDYVSLNHVVPANGRFLSAWSINFGDGIVRNGLGGLPSYLYHSFTTDGNHVITATQTDSVGAITTRSITVNTASPPSVLLGAPTYSGGGSPGTGPNVSIPVTATPGPASTPPGTQDALTSWFASFGDGTFAQGTFPLPNLTHTYASSDFNHDVILTITDDHGNVASDDVGTYYSDNSYTDPTKPTTVSVVPAIATNVFVSGHYSVPADYPPYAGNLPSVPLNNPATIVPDQTLTLFRNVNGPEPSGYGASIDWGDGCAIDYPFNDPTANPYHPTNPVGSCNTNPFSSQLSHSYAGPGTRTVTLRLHKDANPAHDVVSTLTVNVVARQTVAELSRIGVVTQGKVVMSTAGTTVSPAGARWFFYPGDDSPVSWGDGAPPASFSHVYPSGTYDPELYVVDRFGMGDTAYGWIDATSMRARIAYFGGGGNARWVAGIQSTDASGNDNVCFSGELVPSLGARPKGASIDFGDGTSQGSTRNFADGEFECNDAVHGYTKTGEFTAVLAARDTKGQTASEREHVSIATRPTLGFADTLSVTAPSPTPAVVPVSFGTAANNGTNAGPFGWHVNWNDSAPTTTNPNEQGGYGAIPATLSHTYPNPGPGLTHNYSVTVELDNDHGGQITRTVHIVITGA